MTEPHATSDNTAIDAAQRRLTAIARGQLRLRVEDHLRRPTRWTHEALVAASAAVWDRHVADLEAALGRAEGAFGGAVRAPVNPAPATGIPVTEQSQRVGATNPAPITPAPNGERRMVPRYRAVCAETEGDCA